MTTVSQVYDYLQTLAPVEGKMSWDNVGLLCGSGNAAVTKILVALDPFEHVCHEAAAWGAELIVTHHPLIFRATNAVTDETSVGRSIMTLCRTGISAVCAHTNLDCAEGGVNDVLAQTLGLTEVSPIPHSGSCAPGLLRKGCVREQSLEAFLGHVKATLGCAGLRYVSGGKPVRHVAVGGGSCADGMLDALDAGCDTLVTADVKYNQFWDARELGINLIDAGHFHTENPIVPVLAGRLREAFPDVTVKISETHADCMKFY